MESSGYKFWRNLSIVADNGGTRSFHIDVRLTRYVRSPLPFDERATRTLIEDPPPSLPPTLLPFSPLMEIRVRHKILISHLVEIKGDAPRNAAIVN